MLLRVCCLVFSVSCLDVVVVRCSLVWFIVWCWSFVCRCVSFVVYCALRSVCWPFSIYCYILCVVLTVLRDCVYCPLFVVYCLRLLAVGCYLLVVAYCSL